MRGYGGGYVRCEMFIHQGALQLKLWTGREAPLELMRKTVYERLASSEKRNKSKK